MVNQKKNDISLYDSYQQFMPHQAAMTFKGTFTQAFISEVAEILKQNIQVNQITAGKVFAVFIELAQNIRHHSAKKNYVPDIDLEVGEGIISFLETQDSYEITAGNFIRNADRELVEARCKYINTLSHEDLRDYYRAERKRPKRSVGSNVGLIDMARRSNMPLRYEMKEVGEDVSFFELSIVVKKDSILSDL